MLLKTTKQKYERQLTDSPDLTTAKFVFVFSGTVGAGSEGGSSGLEMTSLDTADGTGTGAGTIVGMGTIAGDNAAVTAGILINVGSGDLAITRDDRVAIGSGDTGSGAG